MYKIILKTFNPEPIKTANAQNCILQIKKIFFLLQKHNHLKSQRRLNNPHLKAEVALPDTITNPLKFILYYEILYVNCNGLVIIIN